jgi:hypothetical protein
MLPNPVCCADHPEVRARAGSLRAFLCAGATHAPRAHAFSSGIGRTTRPCDNPARTARSKPASQSIESLRDFARESASSSPMRQSGPFGAPVWPRRRREAVLLLCPCYSLGRIAPSRAKRDSPRTSHCIFPVINNGQTLDCSPFGETGTTVEFRACYSAAVCRRPNWRNERSTHSRVSFSCTPFWARRARRLSKSTRSRS